MSLLLLPYRIPLPPEAPGIFIPPLATYALTINGVAKKLQPGWTINETAKGRNSLSCEVLSSTGTYRPPIGAEAVLTENGARIFGGVIQTPSEVGIGDRGFTGITTRIAASDFNIYAERRHVDLEQPPSQMKALLELLVPHLAPYGVGMEPGQVDGPVLPAVSYHLRALNEVFDEIAMLASGIVGGTVIWEIDYHKVFRMFLSGSVSAPFGIVDGDTHVEGDISVETSRSDYANRIVLLAGNGQRDVVDLFTGNGATTIFPLRYKLSKTFGYVNVGGGVLPTGAIIGGTNETLGSLGEGATWSFNPPTNSITRIAPPGVGVQVNMPMTAQFPLSVVVDGGAAPIDLVERTIAEPEVFDFTVAQGLANAYLARAMVTPRTVRYVTREMSVHPGQTQPISVAKRNLSGGFLITDVRISSIDEIHARRMVTAVEGTTVPESWRESFRSTGGGGTSTAGSVGGVTVINSGGIGGAGTVGKIPRWTTQNTLANSLISDNGATVAIAGGVTAPTFSGGASGLTNIPADQLTGTIPAPSLAGRSLSDLGTRSAAHLTIGSLAFARLPTGAGVWDAAPTINGVLTALAEILGTIVSSATIRITVNNTPYKVRNAAGTGDLSLITGDGSNKTALYCNNLPLRLISSSHGAVPAGAAIGALYVTIDGVGDVAIPYYTP